MGKAGEDRPGTVDWGSLLKALKDFVLSTCGLRTV